MFAFMSTSRYTRLHEFISFQNLINITSLIAAGQYPLLCQALSGRLLLQYSIRYSFKVILQNKWFNSRTFQFKNLRNKLLTGQRLPPWQTDVLAARTSYR